MTSKRSPLFWAGVGLAVLVSLAIVAAGGAAWWFQARFHPAAPRMSFAPPKDEATARLQDIALLRRLTEVDRSFTPESKAAYLERLDALQANAGEMSPIRFELEIAEAVASNGDRQTQVLHDGRLNRLPVRMARFREGFFVTKATAENADLLGAQVLAIGGLPTDEAQARFNVLFGGTETWRRIGSRALLHSPEALQAEGLSAESEAAELTLLLPGGDTVHRRLAALPALGESNAAYQDWMDVVPGTLPGPDSENWQSYLPSGGVPETWLADSQETVATRALERPNALYIRLKPGPRAETVKPLLAAALKVAETKSFHHVIVDLRLGIDAGAEVDDFVRDLPKAAPDGAIFVFTGGRTVSSAMALLAKIKQTAPERVIVIGEPTGDHLQYWDMSGDPFVLPNSKIVVTYATAYHDVEHGCRSFPKCYWPEILKPVAAGPLTLDLPVSQRFKDYAGGRDTAIEAVKALVGGPDAEETPGSSSASKSESNGRSN